MKKIFLIYGHYDDKSFNAAIRDTFIETTKKKDIVLIQLIFIKKNLIQFLPVKNQIIQFWITEKELKIQMPLF